MPSPPSGTAPGTANGGGVERVEVCGATPPGVSRVSRCWRASKARLTAGPTLALSTVLHGAVGRARTRRVAPPRRAPLIGRHPRPVSTPTLRVAVVGSGPAGIYAADILTQDRPRRQHRPLRPLPAPYGLIRYGVAPDHPRIKDIVNALHKVLDRGDIRFFGNVDYGTDLTLEDLRTHYDAVIFATGAIKDADLNIPGIELDGSYGGADFVSWYDGHPDVPAHWPLEAKEIAVIGNGNVALDVARILAKHADDLLVSEIPDNVYAGLKASPVTDVHVFGRRGPAQVKFTPLELRELGHSKDVDIILYPEDFEFDEDSDRRSRATTRPSRSSSLTNWIAEQPEDLTGELPPPAPALPAQPGRDPRRGRPRRRHPHRAHRAGRRRQRPRHRRVRGLPRPGRLPRDRLLRLAAAGDPVRPHQGRHPERRRPRPGRRRHPRAGHLRHRLDQARPRRPDRPHQVGRVGDHPAPGRGRRRGRRGVLHRRRPRPGGRHRVPARPRASTSSRGTGWELLDAHERSLGEPHGRERVKVVPRDEMVSVSLGRS